MPTQQYYLPMIDRVKFLRRWYWGLKFFPLVNMLEEGLTAYKSGIEQTVGQRSKPRG